jgi:hypothetical protein
MRSKRTATLMATLKNIRATSPMWRDGEWHPREAAIMWSIWLQAVQDVANPYGAPPQSAPDRDSAHDTARTGNIRLPDGRTVNALELIEIDPEWAWARIRKTLDYLAEAA